jgi:hypothetical protein
MKKIILFILLTTTSFVYGQNIDRELKKMNWLKLEKSSLIITNSFSPSLNGLMFIYRTDKISFFVDYKQDFLGTFVGVNDIIEHESTQNFYSSVSWYNGKNHIYGEVSNEYYPLMDNGGVWSIGDIYHNTEIGKGHFTNEVHKKDIEYKRRQKILSLGLLKRVSNHIELYGGVGIYNQKKNGTTTTNSWYESADVHLVHDDLRIINRLHGNIYTLQSNGSFYSPEKSITQINTNVTNVNFSFGMLYNVSGGVFSLGYDSFSGVNFGIGMSF